MSGEPKAHQLFAARGLRTTPSRLWHARPVPRRWRCPGSHTPAKFDAASLHTLFRGCSTSARLAGKTYQVVKASLPCAANVHARPLPDRIQALQHLDD